MSSQLHLAGAKLFSALNSHADVVMQAYSAGHVNEASCPPQVIDKLIQLGVLWRPEPGQDARLRRSVRQMLETSLRDERSRHIDADIGSKIANLKLFAAHYNEALQDGKYIEAESFLEDLTEQTYTLTETLKINVRGLWSRIHNEFGYVSSMAAKIRENQLAQEQVSDLLHQIEQFQFDELAEIAGNSRELRRLLVVALHKNYAEISRELSSVQSRLIELMGQFREYLGRTQLLKGFVQHVSQHPQFAPTDYSRQSQVPDLFNQAATFIQPAAIDTGFVHHEGSLHEMVHKLRQVNHLVAADNQRQATGFVLEQQHSIEVQTDAVKQAVEDYFCSVIESGQSQTALDYHQQQQLDFDKEVWIYRVIGGYQGLTSEEQAFFELETAGQADAVYTGNYVIEDVVLGLR